MLIDMQQIEKQYTELVNNFVSTGYIINSQTMSGSQGEMGKVDFYYPETGKSTIIRVLMDRHVYSCTDVITLEIIRYGNWNGGTLFNSKGIRAFTKKFYNISRKGKMLFVDSTEEAERIFNLQAKRNEARYGMSDGAERDIELSASAKKKLLAIVKKRQGYKSVKLNDILSLCKYGKAYIIRFAGSRSDLLV